MVDEPNAENVMGGAGKMSRQGSWTKRQAHTRADGLGCILRQTCDTAWFRCPEEVEYENRAVDLFRMLLKLKEPCETFEEVTRILPQHI